MPSRDDALSTQECAQALKCSVKVLYNANLPYTLLGPRKRVYIWGEVLDALRRTHSVATPPAPVRRFRRSSAA
jgi:hypothetical protein